MSKSSNGHKSGGTPRLAKAAAPGASATPNVDLVRSGFLIHDVSRLRRTAYDQRLKPYGITRAQWWVLGNLSRRNCDGISQIELARLLDVGKVTLGGLIDRLEDAGLVVRVPDKIDRRSKRIMRSPQGRELCERMEILTRELNAEVMNGISEQEHRQMINGLLKMKQNLIKMDALPQSALRPSERRSPHDAAEDRPA